MQCGPELAPARICLFCTFVACDPCVLHVFCLYILMRFCMFQDALDLLRLPLDFLLRFWSFDLFRMFWMVLFWIFILSFLSRIVRMGR